jgi:hypothetical protein
MKKILVIAFVLFNLKSYAQGNLQFNQVLTYAGTINSTQSLGTTYTVPANKVWKIKSVSDFGLYSSNNVNGFQLYKGIMFCLNNKWIFISSLKETFLKAGDTIKIGYYDQYLGTSQVPISGVNFDYFISIVEFNIVP